MLSLLKENLTRYIQAGFPLIYVRSFEEERVEQYLTIAACGDEIIEWNATSSLCFFKGKVTKLEKGMFKGLEEILRFLEKISETELQHKILLIKDIQPELDKPGVVALLKRIAQKINEGLACTIILLSPVLKIPPELEPYLIVLEMEYPDEAEIRKVIDAFIEDRGILIENIGLLEEMTSAFKGLTKYDINNILCLAYADSGSLTKKDISLIFDQKQQMIKKAGLLEMVPLRESLSDIGGLENLKAWLRRKAKILKNLSKAAAFGVDTPKGVLIAGVPGCGKSLSAKAAAKLFEVPLLRLDIGRLMGKYVGESEMNLRRAIALAEAISPCVLWIDEIEKAFAGIGGQSGAADITTRLFGNFLTWMQEKESPVFVVATANNIKEIPMELRRKGRFDELFYVTFPKAEERRQIFSIHLGKRRKQDMAHIDLERLVNETEKYSGADIEGAVKEAIESVFVEDKSEVDTENILAVIRDMRPLGEIMGKKLDDIEQSFKEFKLRNASM